MRKSILFLFFSCSITFIISKKQAGKIMNIKKQKPKK